jgi:hypothetical protein
LAWAPVTGAVAYEVVLQRDQKEVYKARSQEARTVLPSSWTYEGRPMELERGYYRWIVWPILAGGKKAEKASVVSNLHID